MALPEFDRAGIIGLVDQDLASDTGPTDLPAADPPQAGWAPRIVGALVVNPMPETRRVYVND